MRNLFRFLLRQRDNLLFLALMIVSMMMLVNGNMHQRAQAISSSHAAIAGIYRWRNDITEFASLRQVNKDLAEALARERTRNSQVVLTNDSAQVFVDTVRHLQYEYLTAKVINSTTNKERNYFTLDRGTLRGVHKDMGVIGTNGIVGVVREASPDFALVISILSSELTPSVQLKGTGHYGLLKWDTHDATTASLADIAKHVPVAVGDTVVTRGSDGIFPPGIPVGIVKEVTNDPSSNFHAIIVGLSEDLTRGGYVHVIQDLYKAQRDTLEAKATVQ
ncbi:MAG TPA: rod shape-determining protein MreC [Flavobacteriales bacterium]